MTGVELSPEEIDMQRRALLPAYQDRNAAEAKIARLTAERDKADAEGDRMLALAEREAARAEALDRANAALIEARDYQTARADRAEALVKAGLGLADECADSGCIHLNEMYGRLRAALGGAK